MTPELPEPDRPRRLSPHTFFFPAASAYAALVLPWSILSMTGVLVGPRSLSAAYGHAHEMLLGYALAVVAGHQLPALRRGRLLTLFGLWVAARLAFLAFGSGSGLILDAAFAIALAWHVAPRLLRSAKKLRNQALPAILLALSAAAVAFDALRLRTSADLRSPATVLVLLVAALMLFMGGRIIAPAAAGQLYRQGGSLAARVQPRIEAALMIAMAVAVAAAAVRSTEPVMRAACVAAGAFALVRLLRWRLWSCDRRPDLLCLGVGYAWLAFGLLAIGALDATAYRTAALHVITVGALGTLTFNVMASTELSKARRPAAEEPMLVWGTALIGCATVLRAFAAVAPGLALPALLAAAAFWSAAFLLLCWLFLRTRWRRSIGSPVDPHDPTRHP